ncbi:Sec63-domain-containing protein [Melanogaster broomeanus]|nr:Sec63-domain-containing protein [Melanogaster broomeanus]
MAEFAEYLQSLTSSSPRSDLSHDLKALAIVEWTSSMAFDHDDSRLQTSDEDISPWSTVLDLFSSLDIESSATSSLLRRIIRRGTISDSDSSHVLEVLADLLSSSRTNDAISTEVAELVGFDNIELVMELLESRSSAAKELSHYLYSRKHQNTTGASSQLSTGVSVSLAPEDARRRIEETLKANSARPLFTGVAQDAPEALPHVYTSWSNIGGGSVLSHFGSKYALPLGTTRHDHEDYEQVTIPPSKTVPPRESERLILVSELDELCQGSFPGYTSLNRIQSIVYTTAYRSNENVLVCAPTGAGKTDVAMLTILRVLDQHRSTIAPGSPVRASIDRESFKIIYVAPMKALASEIVQKLGRRLRWLSIKVRELTGDMQLTKAEIAETQIIVTTPEKWDVVTRKPTGEGELVSKLKLLIIDEIHLLNEERGAVIEAIVARTLRQVETSQSVIRVVGLSATLPNYIDVADFLSASRHTGLFYFDASFRPIPLEQHFIGIRGKPGSPQSKRNLDRVTFEKVSELVRQGHQVMVFVHARKETVKAARTLKDDATAEGTLEDYSCQDHPQWNFFRRSIGESRNKEMKELFDHGFGIHHAGMLRSDRNMMERMFHERAIKVLCCTATLAWGVNLPAHAVIIKGTQVYDSGRGSFVDLSVLDVLQVFGRAGRPGLETSGEGYICTTEDKLTHYLDSVTSQKPIESQFNSGMVDALNAEIALGTVASVQEGVRWLGYTYLFVRMRKNPFQYGMSRETLIDDPELVQQREKLVVIAARALAKLSMIDFNEATEMFVIKDVGRIAAKYYIRHQSIEVFGPLFKPKMTEADILGMLSRSTEFDQIQVRDSEVKELEQLMKNIPCDVGGGTDTSQGKVNILLQSFISTLPIEDFALVSDTAYAAQNGGRIIRALLEIAISRKWANVTAALMGMSKAIEKRMWPFEEPLRQFNLKAEIIHGLDQSRMEYSPAELATMTAAQLGELIALNEYQGRALLTAAKQFPSVELSSSLRPLGPDTLKVIVTVTRTFNWSSKVHGSAEPFWIWIEDHEGEKILQFTHIFLRESTDALDVEFVISISVDTPPSITIQLVSDRWLGADNEVLIPLDNLWRLDVGFLPRTSIRLRVLEDRYSLHLREFNSIQTQVFWTLMNTKLNVLVAAPTSCGKSLLAHLTIWTTLVRSSSPTWALIVVPSRVLATSTLSELRPISGATGVGLEYSTSTSLFAPHKGKLIRVITTAGLLENIRNTRLPPNLSYPKLILCENLEQLDATYELGVTLLKHRTQYSPTRYIGLSSSLNDPTDLASWLDVDPMGLHSFLPRDREQSLAGSIQTYTIPHSGALFKSLAKPVYTAIREADSSIVFVPSRGYCPMVAQDLITQRALNSFTERGFLPESVSQIYVEDCLARLQDPTLINYVSRGVGLLHHGISKPDRSFVLELFAEGVVRVLIAPREVCWSLPVRAEVVVIMSTQYVQVDPAKSERQLKDYTLVEVVQMQSRAVRQSAPGRFVLFCPAEAAETFNKFLNDDGLPLESQLLETDVLEKWYQEKREDGVVRNKQDGIEALSFTFLARRVVSNPIYYEMPSNSPQGEVLSRIVDRFELSG